MRGVLWLHELASRHPGAKGRSVNHDAEPPCDLETKLSEQLQRYFASGLGCAISAIWATAGFGAALASLAVAAASYASVSFAQRQGILRSSRERRLENHREPSRRSDPSAQRRPLLPPATNPAPPHDPAEVATRYGW